MSKVYNKEELQLRINDILSYLRNIIEDPEGAGVYFSDKLADIFIDVLTGNGDSEINKKFGMVTLVNNTIQFFANEEEYNIYLEDPIKNKGLLLGKVTLPSNTSTTPSIPIPNPNIDLSNYVTLNTDQNISGIKNFLSGIKLNNSPIITYDSTTKSWLLEGNLIVTGGGAFRAALGDLNVPTIMDAILVDEQTITKDVSSGQPVLKVLKAGLDRDELIKILSEEKYATQTWVNDELTKFALKTDLPDTSTLVDLSTYQEILEVKDFKKGLKIGGLSIYKSQDDVIYIDSNVVISKGLTVRGTDGTTAPSIWESIPFDNTMKWDGSQWSVVGGGASVTKDSVINALGYTPLSTSGGTITGEVTISCAANTPLKINSNATDSGVYFNHNGISKTWVGFEASRGSVLYHSVGSHRLGINNDGVAFYDSNTLLHSGNYSEYAVKKNVFINTAIADNEYGYGYVDGGWPEAGPAMVFGAGNYKAGVQIGALGSALRYGYTAGATSFTWRTILDDSNYSDYALPITGGTVNGAITINDYAKVTNDIYLGGVLRNANATWLLGESALDGTLTIGSGSYAQERCLHNYNGKLRLTAEGGVEAQLTFLYSNPTLGSLDTNGVMRLTTEYGWGLYSWIRNTGRGYIQVGTDSRYGSTHTGNDLILQVLGGNVSIGGETASEKLHVYGNILATGGITSRYTSDSRLKQNLRGFKASEVLMSLGAVQQFEYIPSEVAKNKIYEGTHIGLIYQNVVGTALNRMCYKRDDGYGSLNYYEPSFISLLAGVGQEHEIRLTKDELDIKALKEDNKALRKEIEYLKQRVA